MMKAGYEVKVRYQKLLESEKELKKELLLLQKQVNDNKKSIPMPKEPVFDELQPVSYVPKIPTIGMMDNRGKKKKQVPTADFKNILDAVDAGDMDGQDTWTFPENTWPSQAQQLKLGKVITMRNSILDVEREHLLSNREQQEELFKLEMDKWDIAEKQRRNDLEKIKLALRKQYLRYDCFLERANRINAETNLSDSTLKTIVDLRNQHVFAKDSYKMMKIKQYMERERQTKLIEQLTARLLKAIKARSVAMYLPSTARSRIDFAHLQNQSEEALRVLRYELLDCKQLLIDEGIRLRSLHYEELIFCQNELTRLKTSKEILFQRSCMDQILSRYKLEVINFMQQQEKAFLREAEVDFVGVDTIDELGERYRKDKEWKSSEVIKCTKLVEIALAKIALTEGLGQSAMESQRRMINLLTTKYGTEYLAVRDTWIENSDYDRSKMLVRDVSEWIRVEIRKLEDRERQVNCEKELLQQQFDISQQQRLVDFRNHENETAVLRSSSDEVVCVMRSHLYNLRKETKMKISNLESSITRLSRECQKVREDLLAQEIVYEEKLKVLWAFIHTLQTTVQQLSVRMEIILEEREQMVISSKLLADKMRFQLRVERRHCSNLMFIIHAQRGISKYLQDVIHRLNQKSKKNELEQKNEKNQLQKEIWEQVFTFTRLCTDVDALFEFFAARLANLAGSREAINNSLATNGAAAVLAALCKSPRSIVRKFASRALGGMGWNGYVETRILLWDSVMYWKIYKQKVIEREFEEYRIGLENFYENGKFESILNIRGDSEEFEPSANMSLRTLIKQRRQWALRATRRNEGPNEANQRLINIKDGVIPALLQMSLTDGEHDWEIARNAALAISIASYEEKNHHDIISSTFCVELIVKMCLREDPEVKTHAAIIIANLCHNDETAQTVFGQSGAIPVLLSMCETAIVDVLEASSSALANLTCFSDANCKTVIDSNGVAVMIKLITQSYSENLLDLDQNDEVQANAAELFANVSRYMTDYTAIFFDSAAIDVVVLMCASPNKKLRRNIPLVMGNIGHNESCRHMIGVKGGIEALFLILEDHDNTVKANALWALCNLMWHPPNQERAGRFISEIVNSLRSDWDPVRTNGCTLLANVLFYNTQNRIRFLEIDYAMELILDIIVDKKDQSMVEGCLRALLSLSYLDYVALWLGTVGECIPIFVDFLRPPFFTRESLRFSLEIICNLCLHHANRRALFDIGGLELIVSLHVDEDKHIRDLSLKIVEYLEDITPPEVLAQIKMEVGLERMVSLATNTDPLVRAVAVESIGEEIWRDPRKRERAQEIGAVDVMLGIVANSDEPVESLLPTLWSLRNVLSENLNAKSQFGYRDGCSIVANILRSCLLGQYREQSEKIFEAALLCLSTAVLHHERNARKLLLFGLEVVLELADGKASNPTYRQADSFVRIGMRSEGVISLAKSLLLLLAPYNYVICRNCHRKQELHGTSCFKCGYRLLIDIEEESARLLEKETK